MAPLKPLTPANVDTYVNITEPRTGTLQIRASESANLRVAISGVCGYTEHYVDKADVARLWKYWQKGYR